MSEEKGSLGAGRAALILGALVGAHLALVAYFAPRSIQSGNLVLNDAFAIEAYRAFRARAAFDAWGSLWAYDPTVLGGQPAGLVEIFGTRIFVLAVVLSSRLGVDPVRAFNGTITALHMFVPVVAYAAARSFRLGRAAALVTTALWSLLWFFDSLVHYAWFSGRITFALACGVAVLFIGVGSRLASRGDPRWALSLVAIGVVAVILHPVAALLGIAVVVGIAFAHRGVLPRRRALLVGSALAPAIALWPAGGRVAGLTAEPLVKVFDTGLSQILWDVLELSSEGYRAPGATRAMVRVLVLAAGCANLLRYRSTDDYRYVPLAASMGIGTGVAYLGTYVGIRWPLDPYFFAIFGAFAAAVPAAAWVAEFPWRTMFAARVVRVSGLVVFFVAVPRFVRTVATFVPELLPNRVVRSTIDLLISPLAGVKEPLPDRFRHEAAPPTFAIAWGWLSEHYDGRGSILVDDPALAAYLALASTLPIIGPLGERGVPSGDADPSWMFAEPASRERVVGFLDRYGVGWVALWGAPSRFDGEDPILAPTVRVAGVRLRKVRRDASLFVEGGGSVQAALGRVRVTITPPSGAETDGRKSPRVTLRLRYDRSLVCRPGCRAKTADPLTGFITIENPPPEFELGSH